MAQCDKMLRTDCAPEPLKREDTQSRFETNDGRPIVLRPLKRRDLQAMIPFANSFADERKRNVDLGITSLERRVTKAEEKEFLDKVVRDIASKRRVSVAAFHADKLVGHCDIVGRTASDERHTAMLGIIVLDGYRGVGLGEKMMRMALDQAPRLGIWAIELEVFATNGPAIDLYEKLGFKTVGIIPKKILRGGRFTDIVRMYIHLPHD